MIPTELITQLQAALQSPWALLFLGTWLLGWFIKEQTEFENQYVPVALLLWGVTLGVVLVEVSLGGAIVGGVMAAVQMGAYDVVMAVKRGGE